MQANDLIDRVEALGTDEARAIARDLRKFVNGRKLGLVYEESKPEYVRLTSKPVVEGDLVNILPPRGVLEDLTGDDDSDVIWRVLFVDDAGRAVVVSQGQDNEGAVREVSFDDLVAVARFDQIIYCGLKETGRVECGGDKPYHTVINGENFHALELLMFPYQGKIDCIYLDPPYNTGAKDWKYNNNYVGAEDVYRHSKWLTFMEDRLRLAKKLLNPKKSVLICTIDDKEYLRLGLLLEQMFPDARMQMVTTVINPSGTSRGEEAGDFSSVCEFCYVLRIGSAKVLPWTDTMLPIVDEKGKVKGGSRTVGGLKWESFLRSGKGNDRQARPNLFYPIYIDKSTMRIVGAGMPCMDPLDSLPREHDGYGVAWPLKKDGSSAIWHLERASLLRCLEQGYAYVSSYDSRRKTYTIQYLTRGVIKSITDGTIQVSRSGERGQVIAQIDVKPSVLPKNVWNMRSHNGGMSGSDLLSQILPGRVFPYPKSLYAVEDTLRFFVANNPDSLIVDFFAGSGTTAHATMRLNHQDGGHRRSISITNNEVSFEEVKKFVSQGLRQGDEEWEHYGICSYVTVPRITAAITGLMPDGKPIKGDYKYTDEFSMSDGFEENAVFYDLTYIEPSVLTSNLAFDEVAPLLWMAGGSEGPVITLGDTDPDDASYEITDTYGVLFDCTWESEFVDECRQRGVSCAFVVTDIDRQYRDVCSRLRGVDVRQLYKSYLRSFEIGQDR